MIKLIKHFNGSGFTLLEIILTLIIFLLISLIVTPILISSFDILDSSSTEMSQDQLLALAQQKLAAYLRTAIADSTNQFGQGRNNWTFSGYSSAVDENKYRLNLINDTLYLQINSQPQQIILQNVNGFYIRQLTTKNRFLIYLETNVEGKTEQQREFVVSRNYN